MDRDSIEQQLGQLPIFLWSVFCEIVYYFLILIAPVSKTARKYILSRHEIFTRLDELRSERYRASSSVFFLCSSAGEYEQAKPLIKQLRENEPEVFILILFFSPSGTRFAEVREESENFALLPIDSVWKTGKLFEVLSPERTIVVRWELWPMFLKCAGDYGSLYLIDAVSKRSESYLKRTIRSWLLRGFDKIFVADKKSSHLLKSYSLQTDRVLLVGDTKYDRARERIVEGARNLEIIQKTLPALDDDRQYVVVGSGWQPDFEIILEGVDVSCFKLVLVPHELDKKTLMNLERLCLSKGRPFSYYGDRQNTENDIIIVNKIGILSDLYGIASYAFVGGAMHHRVHNVLEPALRLNRVAFGPKYHTSPEAEELVEKGFAKVVSTPKQVEAWLSDQSILNSEYQAGYEEYISDKLGATSRIYNDLQI